MAADASWMSAYELASHAHFGLITEFLLENWSCYWDDTFATKTVDTDVNFVFNPALRVTASGIVTSSNAGASFLSELNGEVESPLQLLVQRMKNMAREMRDNRCTCNSEADYPFLAFAAPLDSPDARLLPEPASRKLDPVAVLASLGAHAELRASVSKCKLAAIVSEDADAGVSHRAFRARVLEHLPELLGCDMLVFECGKGKLNPMPVFIVARLHGALVGFITAKVCTATYAPRP